MVSCYWLILRILQGYAAGRLLAHRMQRSHGVKTTALRRGTQILVLDSWSLKLRFASPEKEVQTTSERIGPWYAFYSGDCSLRR